MIKSFRSQEAEKLFGREYSRTLPRNIQRTALRKLLLLDAAVELKDIAVPPANQLEKLRGDRNGQYSIRINKQWRICFVWREGNSYNVEITDYH